MVAARPDPSSLCGKGINIEMLSIHFYCTLNAVNIGQIIQLNKSVYLLVHSVTNKLARSKNYLLFRFPGLVLTSKQYMDYHTHTNYH